MMWEMGSGGCQQRLSAYAGWNFGLHVRVHFLRGNPTWRAPPAREKDSQQRGGGGGIAVRERHIQFRKIVGKCGKLRNCKIAKKKIAKLRKIAGNCGPQTPPFLDSK